MTRELSSAAIGLGLLLCIASSPKCLAQHHLGQFDKIAAPGIHERTRRQTETRFARASFSSPERPSAVGDRVWMAPLILHEHVRNALGQMTLPRFGALAVEGAQVSSIDIGRPTIYTTSGDVPIHEDRYEQQTYLWFYPPTSQDASPQWRGFRQTLDKQGFAFIREAISNDPSQRVLYISRALEQAAAQQFGAALPGRRYAAESGLEEHPETVVARLVPKGPQPMGPYVYLGGESLVITTLRCRCEASLVDRFSESNGYQLVPLKQFANLFPDRTVPSELRLPTDTAEMDGLLRYPASL